MGALAVVVTLVYLSIQVREGREISQTQSYHLAIEQLVAGAMRPEISLLFESAHRRLTDEERLRLSSPLAAVLYTHEILYYLWRRGQVDDLLWENLWLNNRPVLQLEPAMTLLRSREGPLSKDLLALLEAASGSDA